MFNKIMYLVSFMIVLGMVSTNYAAVLGDFEDGLDNWAPTDANLTQSSIGATLGTQAMEVDGPGDWHIDALLDIKPYRESLGVPGATITADVTAFDADMTTTWMQIEMVINAQNTDDAGANNNIGWQTLGSQDVIRDGQTRTMTWTIPDSLASAIAVSDDNIWWFELALVTNLDSASVTKFYIDNIQLVSAENQPAPETTKSTDVIIGNWEQDMDGWVAGGGADVLFNDHNGVTLDNYSLDIWLPNGDWNQDVLTLDVIGNGLLDAFKTNKKISVDVTRLVADWPTDQIPGWDGIHMIINAGGNGWSLWQDMGYQAGWQQTNGDLTQTATWDYGQYFPDMDFDDITWLELRVVTNANDPAYTGWVWFYLDNMKMFGGGAGFEPQPANGATDVPIDATLSWTKGQFAASHYVYFGKNAARVKNADMDSDPNVVFAMVDDASFDPNGMDFKTQYFWRVDEVNEASPDSPWKGLVWSFTTGNFIVVDDFEDYNSAENQIWYSWHDGLGYGTPDTEPYYAGNGTGSAVGNESTPSYCEETIVHSGGKSLPFYFNNTGAAQVSEIERSWNEPQDWTINNFNALKLFIYGDPLNTAGQLYVIIEDSTGNSAKITNPDASVFTAEQWNGWEIPFDELAASNVDPTAVTKLVIGISNLSGQAGAQGVLYIDDIRVVSAASGANLMTNGGFEDGVLDPWYLYDNIDGATAEVVSDDPVEGNYCLHLVVPEISANFWDVGLSQPGFVFQAGTNYTLSVFMKCKAGTLDVNFKPEHGEDPWEGYGDQVITITDQWAEYSITTPVLAANVDPATITFHIGFAASEIWVDNVRFYEGDYIPPQ